MSENLSKASEDFTRKKYSASGENELEMVDYTIQGEIECDDATVQRCPMIVLDGGEISWDELGKLVMQHEGWKLQLKIIDNSGQW